MLIIAYLEAKGDVEVGVEFFGAMILRTTYILVGSMASLVFKMFGFLAPQISANEYITHGFIPAVLLSTVVFWITYGLFYNRLSNFPWHSTTSRIFNNDPHLLFYLKITALLFSIGFYVNPSLFYNSI